MPDDRHDEELERLLGEALRAADPVPPDLHDAALAAFDFRDLDAALAELVVGMTASVRDSGPAPLVFSTVDLEIAIEVHGRRCRGQVAPAGPWPAWVETAGSELLPVTVDELGRFSVQAPAGSVRIVVDGPHGRVHTQWFVV